MEVLLLVVDISAMFLLVRWSAKSEMTLPDAKNKNSRPPRYPNRPESR